MFRFLCFDSYNNRNRAIKRKLKKERLCKKNKTKQKPINVISLCDNSHLNFSSQVFKIF